MRALQAPDELQAGGRKVCLAIGVFDGVHLGHQQVIRQAVSDAADHEALGVVVTFDRHPNAVVAPDRVPPLIYSLAQKLQAVAALQVDATWVVRFDEAFSRQTGEEFVRGLARDFGRLHSISVGSEFTFGHKRSGTVKLLGELGAELRFFVHGLAEVALDGQVVSSTRIREAVRSGQFALASQMLGRSYSLAGRVIRGDQVGRKLGFPTANLDVRGLVLPPVGVYAAHASCAGERWRAVVNLGFRPTRAGDSPSLHLEAHLLDYRGDLYGQELELTFVEKLRDEQRFDSLTQLQARIALDIEEARRLFAG
jgi:riboflavin kinase/FMN adenylyltransferase